MKKLLIPFIITVYLMQISLIIAIALVDAVPEDKIFLLYIPIFVFAGIALCIGIANLVLAVNYIFKPIKKSYKVTAICKLVLIPFYIINFIFGILIIVGTLNPYLILLFPIIAVVVAIGFVATYAIMFVTSSYNLADFIYRFKHSDEAVIPLVIHFIMHLIFVADLVSGVYLFIKEKYKTVN